MTFASLLIGADLSHFRLDDNDDDDDHRHNSDDNGDDDHHHDGDDGVNGVDPC